MTGKTRMNGWMMDGNDDGGLMAWPWEVHRKVGKKTDEYNSDHWILPLLGCIKCNVDTSFREHLNLNGAGICLQDHQGNIMAIRTNFRHPCLKVAEGEAWALEEAMVFQNHNMNVHARENDAMRVERESDETRGERREAEERRDS
ncbi:hypothetical protein JHK87_040382 [Glycine soja]|nr:hypothetical protein JHK87_040382 [Glycine soja]